MVRASPHHTGVYDIGGSVPATSNVVVVKETFKKSVLRNFKKKTIRNVPECKRTFLYNLYILRLHIKNDVLFTLREGE